MSYLVNISLDANTNACPYICILLSSTLAKSTRKNTHLILITHTMYIVIPWCVSHHCNRYTFNTTGNIQLELGHSMHNATGALCFSVFSTMVMWNPSVWTEYCTFWSHLRGRFNSGQWSSDEPAIQRCMPDFPAAQRWSPDSTFSYWRISKYLRRLVVTKAASVSFTPLSVLIL